MVGLFAPVEHAAATLEDREDAFDDIVAAAASGSSPGVVLRSSFVVRAIQVFLF